METRHWPAVSTGLVLAVIATLPGLGWRLDAADEAATPSATPAIEQLPGSVGTVSTGFMESCGCIAEDHATWYALQRHGPLVELVATPMAGGVAKRYPLPAVLTTDVSSWAPLVVAADGSWVVMTAKDRLVRWALGSGVVEDLLGSPLGSWGCERVPGASSADGTVALRCSRQALLLVDRVGTLERSATWAVGAHGFFDSACWCGPELWYPVVSFDPGMRVQRLLPPAPALPVTLAGAAGPGTDPGRIQLLGADGSGSCLWGTTAGHLVQIPVSTGVMTVVADAADPGMLPTTPTTTDWYLDPQRQLLLGATLSSHPSTTALPGEAEQEQHRHPAAVPQLSLCQRASSTGLPDGLSPVIYDLTTLWQQLLARSRQERLHPVREQPILLLQPRILGVANGEVALAVDFQIRYGFFGSVYEAILILPHSVGGSTVSPRLAGILRYASSGIATAIHDYPVVTTDPGHALAVQYQDSVLLLPLGQGPAPHPLRDPVPR